MNKKDILVKLLEHGYQPHPDSLDLLIENSSKFKEIISELNLLKPRPFVLTQDILLNLNTIKKLNGVENIEKIKKSKLLKDIKIKTKVEVLKRFEIKRRKKTINDFISYFTSRYNQIRKMLVGRLDLINLLSINKLTQRTNNFSIIGLVREKNDKNKYIIIEDLTGELQIFFEDEMYDEILLDDVVGIRCRKEDSRYIAMDIVWPDIPLKRRINRTEDEVYVLFISDFHFDKEGFKKDSYEKFVKWVNSFQNLGYIFVVGDIGNENIFDDLPKNSKILYCPGNTDIEIKLPNHVERLSDPSLVKIHDTVTVLLTHGKILEKYKLLFHTENPLNIMMNLLKRRHILPVIDSDKIGIDDIFVMNEVPDIFITGHFHKPGYQNYKGTTIISNGSFLTDPTFYVIDLKTRRVMKRKF